MRFLRPPETEKKKKSQALVKGGGIGSLKKKEIRPFHIQSLVLFDEEKELIH
jgi:hypothetical protein